MFKFSTLYINFISLLISILIFSITTLVFSNYKNFNHKGVLKAGFSVNNQNNTEYVSENQISHNSEDKNTNENINENTNWFIEIPSINLKANIKEGTTKEILDDYVGHFEDTSKFNGNVGLAAHNRGYKNNYFENLKKLKKDDIILYTYNNNTKKYAITNLIIIEDTNWNILNNTEQNTITLITCVENQPQYRRCVQAVEF